MLWYILHVQYALSGGWLTRAGGAKTELNWYDNWNWNWNSRRGRRKSVR